MNIFDSSYLQITLGLLSALVLFLYAIDNLSKEIQELASEKFRKLISRLVRNRVKGTLVGALATAITQSSSAVTVLAVVLVNTGIISFSNSLGIILGANIGTTITAQLALVNSSVIASVLIIIGFILGILNRKLKLISKPIFFLGLILFTLNWLSSTVEPLKNNPELMRLFAELESPTVAFVVTALFTMIIHSSSITTGIIVILAQGGILPIWVAIPMILGANLGSSITALIASSKLNLFARRAGFANFLLNLIGTLVAMLLLSPFVYLMQFLFENVAYQAAYAHLIFNVINTSVFLLLLTPFEKLVSRIIKGDEEEILFRTKYIQRNGNRKLHERMDDIDKELGYSIENTIKIYQKAVSVFYNLSGSTLMEIQKLETLNDFLDDEITASIVSLSKFKLSEKDAYKTIVLVKVSNTIEQIGDLGNDFSEVFQRMHNLGIPTDEMNIERVTDIYNRLIELFREMETVLQNPIEQDLLNIKVKEEEIYAQIRAEFDEHVHKLQQDDKYNGNVFVDAISIIELSVSKVRDIRKILLKFVREHP